MRENENRDCIGYRKCRVHETRVHTCDVRILVKKESQALYSLSLRFFSFVLAIYFLSRSKFLSLSARPESALTAFYPFIAFNINPSAFKYQSISPFITISISHISRSPSTREENTDAKRNRNCVVSWLSLFPIHSLSI